MNKCNLIKLAKAIKNNDELACNIILTKLLEQEYDSQESIVNDYKKILANASVNVIIKE